MQSVPLSLLQDSVGWIIAAVTLVVGMRFALNGLRADVGEIKEGMKTLVASDAKQNERIVAVETEQESHKGWVRRLEDGLKELRKIVERRTEPR